MQIRIRTTGASPAIAGAAGTVMYEAEFRTYTQSNGGPVWGITTEEILDSLGADVVFEGPQAQPTRYQVAFSDGVEQIEAKWYTKYSVADMDADAIAAKDAEQAKSVRADRNARIAETDWTQGKDIPDNISTAWAEHRQALRDISDQAGFPWTVTWPTKPE